MVAQVAVNDIIFCNEERCASNCGSALDSCEQGIIGCDAVAGDVADVVYTTTGGVTWTNTAAQPFGNDENIESVTCFRKDKNITRWLVVRGAESVPTNPIEIAYSDDTGGTWTNVDVEAAGTRYATDAGALFSFDQRHIWLVSSGGYIFFSEDGGVTWTTQEAGNLTIQDFTAIHFADHNNGYAVGGAGIVVKTDDGGATWALTTAVTGTPGLLCVYVFDADNLMVGDNAGVIWKSTDAGTTWTNIFTGDTAINDISFYGLTTGFAIDDDAFYRTRNGGEDWEVITVPAATEYNALFVCDDNKVYIAGEDSGNDGIVVKVAGY